MTRDKEGTSIYVSHLEMWAIRGIGVILLGLISWIGSEIRESANQMQQATLAIAEIRTELAITKPADILAAVNQLERIVPSRDEIKAIVATETPWTKVRDEWRAWRVTIEASVKVLAESITTASRDRIYRREVISFIDSLRRANPELTIPEFK